MKNTECLSTYEKICLITSSAIMSDKIIDFDINGHLFEIYMREGDFVINELNDDRSDAGDHKTFSHIKELHDYLSWMF